jgi:hypothetical protein
VPKTKEPLNPFYVLLVIVGVVFLITACGYGLMAWRAIRPELSRTGAARARHAGSAAAGGAGGPVDSHPLMVFFDRHGVEVLTGELLVLGAATFGAMWLDRLRLQRAAPAQTHGETRPDAAGSSEKIR